MSVRTAACQSFCWERKMHLNSPFALTLKSALLFRAVSGRLQTAEQHSKCNKVFFGVC